MSPTVDWIPPTETSCYWLMREEEEEAAGDAAVNPKKQREWTLRRQWTWKQVC